MKITYLFKALRAYRAGRIGDVAAYKGLLISARADGPMELKLAQMAEPLPTIDLKRLRTLDPGSFGRTYCDHMDGCGLTPLDFSAECRADLRGAPLLVSRYTLFHDVFHVLLDYDTSLAGECGVWSFVSGQGYGAFDKAGHTSLACYSLVNPWRWRLFLRTYREGLARGRRAASVLAAPLETFWEKPIAEVRDELAISVA